MRDPFTAMLRARRRLVGDAPWLAAGLVVAGLGVASEVSSVAWRVVVVLAAVTAAAAILLAHRARVRRAGRRP